LLNKYFCPAGVPRIPPTTATTILLHCVPRQFGHSTKQCGGEPANRGTVDHCKPGAVHGHLSPSNGPIRTMERGWKGTKSEKSRNKIKIATGLFCWSFFLLQILPSMFRPQIVWKIIRVDGLKIEIFWNEIFKLCSYSFFILYDNLTII
jgi:hypothetical protein